MKLEPLQWKYEICDFTLRITFTITIKPKKPKIMLLCFELQQIRDHFYYKNFKSFVSKSGLRFAITQRIKNLI